MKLVPFVDGLTINKFEHDAEIDPRVVYIADKANHCIRRILIK